MGGYYILSDLSRDELGTLDPRRAPQLPSLSYRSEAEGSAVALHPASYPSTQPHEHRAADYSRDYLSDLQLR